MVASLPPIRPRRRRRIRPLRDAIFVAGGAVLCGLVALFSVVSLARAALETEVQEGLERVAIAAAASIDAESHRELSRREQWGGPQYEATIAPLRRLHATTPDLAYVYTLRLVDGVAHFVLDTAEPGDHDGDGVEDHSFLLDPYPDADEYAYVALGEGRAAVTPKPFTDPWGTFVSAYAPILDRNGRVEGVVGVDLDLADYRARLAGVERAAVLGGTAVLWIALLVGALVWHQQHRARSHAVQEAHLTRQLEDARQAAEAASEAKSTFLANVSHELRTPMTAILGFTQLLEEAGGSSETQRQAVQTVRRNGEHLLGLINDLLDLSRVEADKLDLEHIEYSPVVLVSDLLANFQPRANERNLELSVRFDTALPAQVRGDPTRVRQVLWNLVGNALKFTSEGGVSVALAYSEDPEPKLWARIRDSGIGIRPEQMERLFQPFSQADASTSRRYGGTGLGLALCKRLTQAMGGGIEVHSDGATGSTFTFWVAAGVPKGATLFDGHALQRLQDAPRAALPANAQAPVARLRGRVLLAEDGRDNQVLVQRLLERTGVEVTLANDGAQAWELLIAALERGEPFDLLLTDVQMPRLDGLELTRRVRARGLTLPVVALTAHAMAVHRRQCLEAGCNGYAAKPIDPRQLVAALEPFLSESAPKAS